MTEQSRVLSIQSHVVSGYVGNRAATFPLQTLGFDVDVVNTVQFSNHTGYGFTDGHKTSPEELTAIFNGLITNGLATHARILTGYIPGAAALKVVADYIARAKEEDPEMLYVLDPVMGDVGKGLYVSSDVVPIYKDMLRLATVITPNQFEVELLSGVQITSVPTLHSALSALHKTHDLKHVALSSIPLDATLVKALDLPPPPESYTRLLPNEPLPWYNAADASLGREDDVLVCFASTCTEGRLECWAFALPTVQGYSSGVGDLFSAMLLAHYDPAGVTPLYEAVSHALMTVQQILLRTHLHSLSHPDPSGMATPRPLHVPSVIPSDSELDAEPPADEKDPKRKAKRMRLRELRVVQERHLLHNQEGWSGKKLDWGSFDL